MCSLTLPLRTIQTRTANRTTAANHGREIDGSLMFFMNEFIPQSTKHNGQQNTTGNKTQRATKHNRAIKHNRAASCKTLYFDPVFHLYKPTCAVLPGTASQSHTVRSSPLHQTATTGTWKAGSREESSIRCFIYSHTFPQIQ